MKEKNKILIVGAGFSGATIARELANAGLDIDIIDSRDHVAGNAYDKLDLHGIRIHCYGPHLFHTSNFKVVQWLSAFTGWVQYRHRVKAMLPDGRLVTLPVNKETESIVGEENVFDVFFRPYSKKMWGVDVESLDPSIIKRIPVRNDNNEFYFPKDKFQMLPKGGYTRLIENMLDHPRIRVKLNLQFSKDMESYYEHTFNSMAIDEYFNYIYGYLPYRSLRFHHVTLPMPKLLPVSVVNFTHQGPYTRITEWKNLPDHGMNDCFTTLTYEEPCDYRDNQFRGFYPIMDTHGDNKELYRKYRKIVPENVTFIGRCGRYVYIDMDQAVASALTQARQYLKKLK